MAVVVSRITDDSGIIVVDWSDGNRTRLVTASQVYVPMHGGGRIRYAHGLVVGMTRAKAEAALRRAVRAHVKAREACSDRARRRAELRAGGARRTSASPTARVTGSCGGTICGRIRRANRPDSGRYVDCFTMLPKHC